MSWQYPPPVPNRNNFPPTVTTAYGRNNNSTDSDDFTEYLTGLTTDGLTELMENEDKINELVMDNDKLKQSSLDKEMITASSRSIADSNLCKEPALSELKQDLERKYEIVKRLYDAYQTNQAKIASYNKNSNLETLLAILQTRLSETEDEAAELERKLNSDEININLFMEEYKNKRQYVHMLRAKVDKMRELVIAIHQNKSVERPAPKPPAPVNNVAPYPSFNTQANYHNSNSAYPHQPSGQIYSSSNWGY